jgi:TnpA family transposase
MDKWQATFLGLKQLPRELTAFEIEAFFTFMPAERQVIEGRRRSELKLGLALQIGFLRMSGRLLDAVRIVPAVLWRHLGEQFGVAAPDLASLRAMYRRGKTLFEHQQLACEALGFRWLSELQRRALMRALRQELTRTRDQQRLLVFARCWLYEHHLIILHERALRSTIITATRQYEAALAKSVHAEIDHERLECWRQALVSAREAGLAQQSWLWAAPAKHSTRQIEELLDRIETLYELGVHRQLIDVPDDLLRRYARRLASRPPSAGQLIREPLRTIEVAYFLRYCLLMCTDRLLLMVRRRVADLWRRAAQEAGQVLIHWSDLYRELLASLATLASNPELDADQLRTQLMELIGAHQQRKPPTRSQLVRDYLTDESRPVRSLLSGLLVLPWQAVVSHPVLAALQLLQSLYEQDAQALPASTGVDFGKVWKGSLSGQDRKRALRAFEVATLLALRRALRNGTVWIDHSLAFRSRARLFIPAATWQQERGSYYRRLGLPKQAQDFLEPLIERAQAGVAAVAKAAEAGELEVDEELHLTPLAAEEEDPELVKLRAALDGRIGEAQLPELMLEVDASVRFSWIMLGREPRSDQELLMVYAGILAHGTAMSAAETARMIPQLSASSIRQAMRWAGDERRLAQACVAVLGYMHRHPIAANWGRSDLASSDMMSLETRQRVWQARIDPRRQTPSVGIYSHVRDRWGIFYAQPIVLNERQVGAAIEGVLRQQDIETAQLAVDTHGWTDFGMAFARGAGFDLCPRLKALKDRQLYLPRGSEVPQILASICSATLDLKSVPSHWDEFVHLIASAYSGHTSAINVLVRFGSAARGDPLYEVGVVIGRLLRTVYLADYFVNPTFRRELLRVLNRGEATNALKRLIYTGRVSNYQAKREDEMQAVADALSLLANTVMAWNTAKMQIIFDRWAQRRSGAVSPELIGRIAPTRTEGINMRGVFRFPIEQYAERLLPSWAGSRVHVLAR